MGRMTHYVIPKYYAKLNDDAIVMRMGTRSFGGCMKRLKTSSLALVGEKSLEGYVNVSVSLFLMKMKTAQKRQ